MGFIVVYDANVLYPNVLRDVLLRVGLETDYQPRWTQEILDEVFRKLTKNRPDLDEQKLQKTRRLMNEALPDACVSYPSKLLSSLTLPDPKDRHVLAAAISCHAELIITANLKDFPTEVVGEYGISAIHPDDFLSDVFERSGLEMFHIVRSIAKSRKNCTTTRVLDELELHAPVTVKKMRP